MHAIGHPAPYELDTSRPLRWGVVGTGGIARKVMSDLLLIRDAQLVAVCSRSVERGAAFADGLALPPGTARPELTVFDSLDDMLPDIDVLYVATPHGVHHEAVLPALESGTAVLAEKALTVSLELATAMVAASREHKTFLMEAIWARFNPLHVKLRSLIAEGALGELRRVVNDFSFLFPFDPKHRLYDPVQGGGALFDLGPYPVSFIQSLLGDPDTVRSFGSTAPNGVEDTANLLFEYPDGVVGFGTCSMRVNGANTATVTGTLGRVDIEANALAPQRMTLHRDGAEPEVFDAGLEGAGYLPELREVQSLVRSGAIESPVMPHHDSLSIMRILTDAVASIAGVG